MKEWRKEKAVAACVTRCADNGQQKVKMILNKTIKRDIWRI